MADFCDIQAMIGKAEIGLANRWFQPLTHVSSGGFPSVSAVCVKRGIREKRGRQRFGAAQRAAQYGRGLFSRRPNWQRLGLTYEDSRRIADRKSAWMVLYLRARRDGDCLRAFYRRQHFRPLSYLGNYILDSRTFVG